MEMMLGLPFLFALFSDSTGNKAVCSLCQNEDHILHLLSNFSIHTGTPAIKHCRESKREQLKCVISLELEPAQHSGHYTYHVFKSHMTFPHTLKKKHLNTSADFKSFYVSSQSVKV